MSSTLEPQARHTPEDLLAMPDGKHFELRDGRLRERNVSALSSLVAATLTRLIGTFCQSRNLAWVFNAGCGYRCFPDGPAMVRRADVSYLRQDRLPLEQLSEGFVRVAPDLVVEMVSPNDTAYEVDRKVSEYRGAGVRLIWVVNPEQRIVRIHRLNGSVNILEEYDDLDGEDVLPGFHCHVSVLFPARADT